MSIANAERLWPDDPHFASLMPATSITSNGSPIDRRTIYAKPYMFFDGAAGYVHYMYKAKQCRVTPA